MAPGYDDAGGAGSVFLHTEPCPKCGSKDNAKRYADGHLHCFTFGCGYREKGDGGVIIPIKSHPPSELIEPTLPDAFAPIKSRGLKPDVLRAYGYFKHVTAQGVPVGVAPYYSQDGVLVAQKLRYPDKSFPCVPKGTRLAECKLFGQQFYGERFDRKVIVTEGEIDTMTVAQVVDMKVAVVSVATGAECLANVKANWRWLDHFKEIVLWFDDDEAGRKAAAAVAPLFAVGKVKIAKAPGFKDASDVLKANRPGDITTAIYAAETWRPRGIINASACLADVLTPPEEMRGYDWPWAGLNAATMGVLAGGVTYIVAGSGIGKTTALYEIEYKLLCQGVKIGHMGFEDMRADVLRGIMGVHADRRLSLDLGVSEADVRLWHEECFSDGRFEMFDPETAEWSIEAIFGYARYMVKALDCFVITIDPLSFLAAGLGAQADERRELDAASMQFSKMAKELACHFIIPHHLKRPEGKSHEEGGKTHLAQLRGSGGIANFSTLVLGFERDQQGDNACHTDVRILKNRRVGQTGIVDRLIYDPVSGRLLPRPTGD